MSSEEHKEQEEDPSEVGQQTQQQQQQEQHQQYPESRQADTWNKDVTETGRWGSRSSREVYLFAAVVLLIVVVTITGVAVAVKKQPNEEGKTKIDPATGERVSAYEVPVPPTPKLLTDQKELDFLRQEINAIAAISPALLAAIPKTVAELSTAAAADTTSNPYLKAAAWLIETDKVNAQEQAVARFALAAIYYNNGGASWFNTTNWLSGTSNHCDWYGVTCCPQILASTLCVSTDFNDVIALDLYKNNLTGTIPVTIALLPKLQTLFMNENKLSGTIPGSIFASLKNFTKLYVQHNKLTGTIPTDLDTNDIFDTLYVQGNDLTGDWPESYCGACSDCAGKVVFFGIDCHKVNCDASCCQSWDNCFYHNITGTVKAR